jgi:hypothetical protein
MQLRRAPVARIALALVSCATLSIGCHSTGSAVQLEPLEHVAAEPEVSPSTVLTGPLTWQKLEQIEQWLETPESRKNPGERIEAELQLNEGRVNFAKRDAERSTVPQDALRVRLQSARDGFGDLLKTGQLLPGQTARAQIGLHEVDALLESMKKAPAKSALVVIDRSRWGALAAETAHMTPLKGSWSRITVHHSAETSSDPNGGSLEDSAHTLRLIQKYHMEDAQHHWGDIGYHFAIDSAGRVFECRELKWQGAHAGGKDGVNNAQNIGICMLGDFARRAPTPAALKSLELLIADLRARFPISASRLYAHHDFKDTDCPGPFLIEWVKKHR